MLRAVFVRTLKPGVSYQDFTEAWIPEDVDGHYPAAVTVNRNVANDRQVITILEVNASIAEFTAMKESLTRPDATARLSSIVETTELEGLYEQVCDETSL